MPATAMADDELLPDAVALTTIRDLYAAGLCAAAVPRRPTPPAALSLRRLLPRQLLLRQLQN